MAQVSSENKKKRKRWFDGERCCLKSCHRLIKEDESAVAFLVDFSSLPKQRKKDRGEEKQMLVAWGKEGERKPMHKECWDTFLKEKQSLSEREKQFRKAALSFCENYDRLALIQEKAKAVSDLILAAKGQVVFFTGAGISTNCGIPDYRGTAGVDTLAQCTPSSGKSKKKKEEEEQEEQDTDYTLLQPSETHKIIGKLEKDGYISYVITQNCDDLHAKGGTSRNKLTELHGNVFVEFCEKCYKEYVREYEVDLYSTSCYLEKWFVKCSHCSLGHFTGRKCTVKGCRGRLKDTIINFGDPLHTTVLGGLKKAHERSQEASLCLTLGSSLTVSPANSLPLLADHLVICNLQETKLDKKANIRIFADTDTFMNEVKNALSVSLEKGKERGKKRGRKEEKNEEKRGEEEEEEEEEEGTITKRGSHLKQKQNEILLNEISFSEKEEQSIAGRIKKRRKVGKQQ